MPAIVDMVELTDPALSDLLVVVDDPTGTPITKKALVSSLAKLFYPVGSLFFSIVNTDPATQLGFGTWAAFGAGKAIVGVDGADTDFDTAEKVSGAKTHTLTSAQMPIHTHVQDAHTHTQNSHNHTQDAHTHVQDSHNHTQNAHSHVQSVNSATTGGLSGYTPDTSTNTSATSGYSTATTVATNQATTATNQNATATNQAATATNQNTTATNQNTGGGTSHPNVQPSIAVYIWKRTA